MALTSKISEYDCRWPNMFATEKARLAGVFGTKKFIMLEARQFRALPRSQKSIC